MPRCPDALLAVALASGCSWTPERFAEARAPFLDPDGDGYSAAEGDCSPHDPGSYPGAEERCDGLDNDCNGSIDDNPAGSMVYGDGDGDGFGNPELSQASCEVPEGFVADASDCDDGDPEVGPGMPERCNDVDDNCDGTVDEGAPADRVWYPDSDGDGHGEPATPLASCAQPAAGYVLLGDDCDDRDPAVSPSALERCNGFDDTCDGEIDEEPSVDPPEWRVDADGDGYGDVGSFIAQCSSPGERYVDEGGDCDDLDPAVHPGAPELCNEVDDDCDGAVDDPPTIGDGVWYVDADEDGYGDVAGGTSSCDPAPGLIDIGGDCDDSDAAVNPEASETCNDGVDNNCDGTPDHCVWDASIDMTDHTQIFGQHQYDLLGQGGAVGDLDGDGTKELYGGAYGWLDPADGYQQGRICGWEVPLSSSAGLDSCDLLFTASGHAGIGYSLAIGDVNGDGFDDLVSGNAADSRGEELGEGSAFLALGPLTGGAIDVLRTWELTNSGRLELFGEIARAIGDLDGDGHEDFGFGGPSVADGLPGQGAVFLYVANGSGTDDAVDAASASVTGTASSDNVGADLGSGDPDGDGLIDIITGAPGAGPDGEGAGLLYTGPVRGDYTDRDADAAMVGEHSGSWAGNAVDIPGDLDNDGYDDVVIGAHVDTWSGGSGAVFLVHGSTTLTDLNLEDADLLIRGDATGERIGYRVRGLDDVNQDGALDLGFTSRMGGSGGGIRGSAYLMFGPITTTGTVWSSSVADVAMQGKADEDSYLTLLLSLDADGDTVPDVVVGSSYGGPDEEGVIYIVPGIGY
jgi:hypothetical protein